MGPERMSRAAHLVPRMAFLLGLGHLQSSSFSGEV